MDDTGFEPAREEEDEDDSDGGSTSRMSLDDSAESDKFWECMDEEALTVQNECMSKIKTGEKQQKNFDDGPREAPNFGAHDRSETLEMENTEEAHPRVTQQKREVGDGTGTKKQPEMEAGRVQQGHESDRICI